jgi:hypothetical protein
MPTPLAPPALEVVLQGRKRGHGNNTGRKFGLQLLLRHHTPLREQKRVGRALEGNIGDSSGTGGPSGVIAQTDLSRVASGGLHSVSLTEAGRRRLGAFLS